MLLLITSSIGNLEASSLLARKTSQKTNGDNSFFLEEGTIDYGFQDAWDLRGDFFFCHEFHS